MTSRRPSREAHLRIRRLLVKRLNHIVNKKGCPRERPRSMPTVDRVAPQGGVIQIAAGIGGHVLPRMARINALGYVDSFALPPDNLVFRL